MGSGSKSTPVRSWPRSQITPDRSGPDGAPDPLLATATAWWEREGTKFEHGALYKYGRRQDLSCAFD
jgi:hypothetical protein